MLNLIWLVAAVFVVLWIVGLSTAYTMGGLIHILLALALIAIIVRLVMGRRATTA